MRKLGFDEVRFDKMGNTIGRIGNGKRVMVYDSHIDTVGIGDPNTWEWDPFKGKVENGVLYARGASDEKGSTPGMVYGLAMARDLGFLDDWTVYYFGNMEEWSDGIAPNTFVEVDPKMKPDFVVIGATNAPADVAKPLEIQRDDVLLRFESQLFDVKGTVVDYSVSYFIPGYFNFHINRRVETI